MTTGDIDHQRPPELDEIRVRYDENGRWVTCFCDTVVARSIVPHLKSDHPDLWLEWVRAFVKLRGAGYPLKRIMRSFADGGGNLLFSWTVVERAIRDAVESCVQEYSPPRKKKITAWVPKGFTLESGTIWDFPRRGDWAVHKGDYRGNWPPQLARNLIEKYSCEGDLVVDLFTGGGTTLIEAWLLQRRSLGIDLSRLAVEISRGRLDEMEDASKSSTDICLDPELRPLVIRDNALNLREIMGCTQLDVSNNSLVCVHPPYLNALQYTKEDEEDLSRISDPQEFIERMGLLAEEIREVLPPGGTCGMLMGDVRKAGKLIPLGYHSLNQFTKHGFELQDIIIKTQHRDRSSEFYVGNDKQLLLSHEYLFILKKPFEC